MKMGLHITTHPSTIATPWISLLLRDPCCITNLTVYYVYITLSITSIHEYQAGLQNSYYHQIFAKSVRVSLWGSSGCHKFPLSPPTDYPLQQVFSTVKKYYQPPPQTPPPPHRNSTSITRSHRSTFTRGGEPSTKGGGIARHAVTTFNFS